MGDEHLARLRELQARFYALATAAENAGTPRGLIRGDSRLSAEHRLRIYANMYAVRLRDALAEDFPKLLAVLGRDRFDALVVRYVRARPPTHPSLRYLGAGLADFLSTDLSEHERAWLADLARLEWARVDVFDAADAEALELGRLAELPAERWPALVLKLVPAATIVELSSAADAVWAAVEAGTPPELPPRPRPRVLVVWRRELTVIHRTAEEAEGLALKLVAAGASFAEVCQRLAEGLDAATAAQRAFTYVSRWTQAGLLAAVLDGA